MYVIRQDLKKVNFFRLFLLLLFYTPRLGLFDSLHHARFSVMMGHADPTFDYLEKQVIVGNKSETLLLMPSLEEAWSEFRQDDLYGFCEETAAPPLLLIPLMMAVIHVPIAAFIFWLSGVSGIDKEDWVFGPLITIICPPLFVDWVDSYVSKDRKLEKSWNGVR